MQGPAADKEGQLLSFLQPSGRPKSLGLKGYQHARSEGQSELG